LPGRNSRQTRNMQNDATTRRLVPMPSTPRSRKLLDPRTRRKLVAELRAGPTRSKALERLHISESTFYRELERSAELRALVNGHGEEKANGDRNGNGTAPRAKANGEGRTGRERRREGGDAPNPGAVAQDLPAQARTTADASPVLPSEVPGGPIAEPEPAVAAPVAPFTTKASKAPKRPRTSKRADRARQKGEVATDTPPAAERGRKRRARADAGQAVSVATAEPDASASTAAGPHVADEPVASEVVATAPADVTSAPALGPKKAAARPKPPQRPRLLATLAVAEAPVAPAKVRRSRGSGSTTDVQTVTAAWVTATRVTAARAAPTPARRRQAMGSQQAYWLPPVLVLASELVVGLVVGASPIILLLLTGSMVAVLYVVRRWGSQPTPPSRRSQPPRVVQAETNWPPPAATTSRAAPIAGPIPGQQPPLPPIDNRPSGSVSPAGGTISYPARRPAANPPEQPSAPQGEAGHNDLRWLWNSIGRDPRPPRPPRRDGR
jgi:hypothetical protein